MAIQVGPTTNVPTHDFTLSDGVTTLGFILCNSKGVRDIRAGFTQAPMPRTAMKLSQGAAKYEDFELPFTSIIQESFEGGMLAKDLESDTTKYRIGSNCDTIRGNAVLAPKATEVADLVTPPEGSTDYDDMYEAFVTETPDQKYGSKITPASNLWVYDVTFFVSQLATEANVYIYSDNAGSPGTLLASQYVTVDTSGDGDLTIRLTRPVLLEAGSSYYICINYQAGPLEDKLYTPYKAETGTELWAYNDTTDTWVLNNSNRRAAYKLNAVGTKDYEIKFFQYKRRIYMYANFDAGGSPMLFANGYQGAAKSNSNLLSYLNTGLDLSGVDLTGCVAVIIEGPGSKELQPWRKILGNSQNGTNDSILVSPAWGVPHTTETVFAILGSNNWDEITGHGLTKRVTDICVTNDYVIFAQGDEAVMRRMKAYNNIGTWTLAYENDTDNYADLLLLNNNTEGITKIWKALKDENEIRSANVAKWGTAHAFGDAIKVGNDDSQINNLIAYGDPLIPYVLKEDSFGSIENDIYAEIPVGEMKAVRSSYNGIAAMAFNVYLYFNMGEMIERYYDRRLDNIGPTLGEGMPGSRKGIVRKLLSYPGRYYAMLYSEGNVPSILCHNGLGWNEVWHPTTSEVTSHTGYSDYTITDVSNARMNDIIIQVVPGTTIDRMYFDCDGKIYYLPITLNPETDSEYQYESLGQLETAWIYGNLKDVKKYWHSIKLHTENLSGEGYSGIAIMVEYKVDNDTDWTYAGWVDESPVQEIDLSPSHNVTGNRIKLRFTLHTDTAGSTPKLLAYVVKGVIRVDVKKGWNVQCISINETDLTNAADTQSSVMAKLYEWSDSDQTPAPLTMRHNISDYDNKKVFIEAPGVAFSHLKLNKNSANAEREYQEILSFLMYEV